jgi:peptidyl-prolyl cis-trans isomerase C
VSCSIKSSLTQGHRKTVSVNGVVIAHDIISRETQNHPAADPAVAWAAATRALVLRELLLQEARRSGLQAQPLADGAGRRETDAEALVRGVIETQVLTPAPDEASCRRFYESNFSRFRSADIFECVHILIAGRRDQAEAFGAARERAEAILARLRERPDDFAALATAHSDCPSRATGGNLGQVTRGMTTPEFESALLSLTGGEVSPLVETRYGLHIIRLDRHIPGNLLPFELVHTNIETYLAERSQRVAVAQYIALLADRAQLIGVDLPSPGSLRVH